MPTLSIKPQEPDNQETEETENEQEDQPLLEREIDPRIPEIIQARANGLTWNQVGEQVNLTSRAIYDIRQKEPYMRYLTDYLFPKTLGILGGIIEDPKASDYKQMKALDEILKLIRAIIPKQIESKSLEIQARLELTSKRISSGEILDKLRSKDNDAYETVKQLLLEME